MSDERREFEAGSSPGSPPGGEPGTPLSEEEKERRLWGMLCHLSAFGMFVAPTLGHIIGPLIVWLLKRHDLAVVEDQGKEALNFQISITIYWLFCLPLVLIGIGWLLLFAVWAFNVVMIVLASFKAQKGQRYRYPFCIRLIP